MYRSLHPRRLNLASAPDVGGPTREPDYSIARVVTSTTAHLPPNHSAPDTHASALVIAISTCHQQVF